MDCKVKQINPLVANFKSCRLYSVTVKFIKLYFPASVHQGFNPIPKKNDGEI